MKKALAVILVLLLTVPFLSIIASADDLVNVALGKKYTVDIGEQGQPYDNDSLSDGENGSFQRLTDGVVGGTDGGLAGLPGAQYTPQAVYVIDLGSVVNGIKKFNMDMYYGPWGIKEPKSVEYEVSVDGVDYTYLGKVEKKDAVNKSNEGWYGDEYILTLSAPVSARYVRVTATGDNFIWSTEIQVFADPSANNNSSRQTSSASSSQASSSQTSSSASSASSAASSSQQASSQASSSQTGSNPQTGDAGLAVFAVLALISAGTVYAINRRSRLADK